MVDIDPEQRSQKQMSGTTTVSFVVPEELLARCVGRVDLARRVVGAFVEQLNKDVPQLAIEINHGELEEATKLAHRIKGASANVAAEEIRCGAECVEHMARDCRMEGVQAAMKRLESDWRHYIELTNSFLAS